MKIPSLQDDSLRVDSIKRAVAKIDDLVTKTKRYDAFLEDWMTQDALIKNIELIGEYV